VRSQDFEYPPETLSLFDFADNCDSDSALLLESSSGRIRRTRHSIGRHGVRHVRRMQRKFRQSAAVHSDSDNAILLETIDQTADGPPRYFVTDPRGYAAVVRELAKPFERNIRLKTEVIQVLLFPFLFTFFFSSSMIFAIELSRSTPNEALLHCPITALCVPRTLFARFHTAPYCNCSLLRSSRRRYPNECVLPSIEFVWART
jgi:hypothetical protein